MAACELVGSSARATRGLGAAWVRKRRVWGCSPSKQSSCDGLAEEIDESALLLGKNRGGGIRARRKTSGVVRWFGELGMVAESSLRCLL